MTVGEKIRAKREEMGMSQERLAELADVCVETIGRIERGESTSTRYTLSKIEDALAIFPGVLSTSDYSLDDLIRAMAFAAEKGINYFRDAYCEAQSGQDNEYSAFFCDYDASNFEVIKWWLGKQKATELSKTI